MDRPKKYGLKRKPIPYYGGVVLVIVFLVSIILFVEIDKNVIGLIIGSLMIAGISIRPAILEARHRRSPGLGRRRRQLAQLAGAEQRRLVAGDRSARPIQPDGERRLVHADAGPRRRYFGIDLLRLSLGTPSYLARSV